jgi:serine/threonine protein kinase
MPLAPNQQLFEYRIVGILGQGAFGIVYLAHDTLLDRRVAIKELTITAQTDEVALKRFIQEARAASGLNHPHIVTVYALKVVEANVYLVMEYLAGGSLRTLLEKRNPLPVEEAGRIAADVCEGLAAAHAKGIVHRDVKPENILLTEDGRAKMGDFGIAHVPKGAGGTKLTQVGFQPGTLSYMSPEQVRGQPVDERSDVYGVGVVLHEMLTGRHYVDVEALGQRAREMAGSNVMLFQARLYELLAGAVCEREPEGVCRMRPEVPGWVGEVVAVALAKRVEERPTAARLAQALRERSVAQVISAEGYFSHSEAYAQQAPLNVGRVFVSTQRLDVLGQPRLKPGDEWQELGRTPGKVMIPPDYDPGIRPRRNFLAGDDNLAILTQELSDFGSVQWLDFSANRRITDAGLAHLHPLTNLIS